MSEPILSAQHLRKAFGGLIAVEDVSLDVARGHVHSIIGPNGAGKTTLMNLLSGIFKPTAGTIQYDSHDITEAPLYRRAQLGIGRSFQITNIFPHLSVLENVRLAAQARSGIRFKFLRSRDSYTGLLAQARRALETVGLAELEEATASTLPHGGKRKLELAILLVQEPTLLILDEPTAGMASHEVPDLIHIIETIRKQGGKTVIIVEHNMSLVMNVSDRITVMHLGNVLAEGTPSEIASNATVQKAYLGELYSDVMDATRGAQH
ncbi:MAG TPA: ABC transporter ATP-binding protein [Aggregatilineales bacterium]|nr:ABC transporter ATP-binding protein [Aggregatilineales bacterium]